MTDDKKANSFWSEALLLAFVPAIGYAMTALHEVGYMNYFDMPSYLIRVDPATAFITSTWVLLYFLLALSLVYYITGQIEPFAKKPWLSYYFEAYARYIIPIVLFFFYLAIPYFLDAELASNGVWSLYKLVCYGTAVFILFAFNRDLTKSLPKPLPILLVILLFAGFWSYHWGVREAKKQKWFLVPEERTDMAVFRIYGDNCIISKFDRPNKTTLPHLTIQPLGDASPKEASVLIYEPIGPLKPWKKND
ncbi:MAG: hypothetical protein ACK42H_07315 [Planctomycetota bacterium]